MNIPDLRGRRLKWSILRDTAGWRVKKAIPVLYKVGVCDDGTVGRVRAEEGLVECTVIDPDNPNHFVVALFHYPEHFATERVRLAKRSVFDENRYGEVDSQDHQAARRRTALRGL